MIYLTSDLHFNHNKEFVYAARGFSSVQEMNEDIIQTWNGIVTMEDDIYVLGDMCLGGGSDEILRENRKLIQSLKGKIHFIRGNHDSNTRMKMYAECYNVVEIGKWADMLKYGKYHFYLSHYPTLTSNLDQDKPLKARVINLCGHSHTIDKFADWDKGLIYHCEVDAHNNIPVVLELIINDIKHKIGE